MLNYLEGEFYQDYTIKNGKLHLNKKDIKFTCK